MRHNCDRDIIGNRGRAGWALCTVCEGRLHLPGCTTRRDPKKDCCEARHKMLAEQGQAVGLADSSFPMYDPTHPTWA